MPRDPQPRGDVFQGERLSLRCAAGGGALFHELLEPLEGMRVPEHRFQETPVTRFQLLARHVAGSEVAGGIKVAVVSVRQPPLCGQSLPQPRAFGRLEHRDHREEQARLGDETLLRAEDIPVVRVEPHDHPSHDVDALRLHLPHRLCKGCTDVLPFAGFDQAFPVGRFDADEGGIDVCRFQQGEKFGVRRPVRGDLGDEPHPPPRRRVDRCKP